MKPKKSLGQHFLHDEKALKKIASAADLKLGDNVLEIGPGTGTLTNVLTEVLRKGRVIAVEKDKTLAREIKTKNSNLKIIEGDILKINLPKLIEENDFFNYKVVANIPYYITGKIIRLLFETKYQPKLIVLLIQKEVAERICAKSGAMSILSVAVQYFGKAQIIEYVSRESFLPMPKVDSAIIKIIPHDDQAELNKNSDEFFRIVRIGFSSRRKTLVNNLSAGFKIEKNQIEDAFMKNGMSKKIRAQNLKVDQWKKLQKISLHR